jgi:hypothetical protein
MSRQIALLMVIAMWTGMVPLCLAGPYAPPAGEPNSTAIHKDDPNFVAWATGVTIQRGYVDINEPGLGNVSYGNDSDALGKAEGDSYDVISLGDGGTATVTFEYPITDGPGYDFAVFENAFDNTFLELAFVEVSSDGNNFFRFNSVSLTPTNTQVGSFGNLDTTNLHNLAGKYRQGYGTPFDLEELADVNSLLDINFITHVRIIDVVGCIKDEYASYDSLGNKINDPWPTPFSTGGFDLDAVGVIHEKTLLADFNNDGVVNFSDYSIFLSAYLSRAGEENWKRRCDISEPADNVIDMLDFARFVDEWLISEQ